MSRTPKESAGLLLYRRGPDDGVEVLLGHPGGPFWAGKDVGAWSIPKGEVNPGEDHLAAAKREVLEETGFMVLGPFADLGTVTQKSGKIVSAWAAAHDQDPTTLKCNTLEIEWPPRSGRTLTIPELDRAEYFSLENARIKMNPAQAQFLDRLVAHLASVA